jgi:hypothetical protein
MSDGTPTLTAELIVDGAVPRNPVISPDGRWVAYVVAAFGVTEPQLGALWVAAADGSSPPRELTAAAAPDCAPRWAPDSASLFFEAGQQLHLIGLDGGTAGGLTTWRSGISDLWPLAGGHVVAAVAVDEPTEEDEPRQAERDDAMVRGERLPYGRLRLLDLGTRTLRVVDGTRGQARRRGGSATGRRPAPP